LLVLTRRVEQKVFVGDEIAVQILGIRGDAVSIGIAAPPRVVILREEILEAVRRENRRAALAGWEQLADVEALFGRRR
jgi:carbon storage regulator